MALDSFRKKTGLDKLYEVKDIKEYDDGLDEVRKALKGIPDDIDLDFDINKVDEDYKRKQYFEIANSFNSFDDLKEKTYQGLSRVSEKGLEAFKEQDRKIAEYYETANRKPIDFKGDRLEPFKKMFNGGSNSNKGEEKEPSLRTNAEQLLNELYSKIDPLEADSLDETSNRHI